MITDARREGRRRTRDNGLFSASSSGASFLAWFRKARNASDWWWRARDRGKRERSVGTRGDCSSLITLQWLSFGYQFPWWSAYFLPPRGLRLLSYLTLIVSGASPSSNLCLVCKEIIFRRMKDPDLTVEPWNGLLLRGLLIFFLPYKLLEEESRSLYRGVQLTKRVIIHSILKSKLKTGPRHVLAMVGVSRFPF